jgi:hypothetical protein
MFIATRAPQSSRSLGARPVSGKFAGAGKSDYAPMEIRIKERAAGYKHLAPPLSCGEATNNDLLHFQLEFAIFKTVARTVEFTYRRFSS